MLGLVPSASLLVLAYLSVVVIAGCGSGHGGINSATASGPAAEMTIVTTRAIPPGQRFRGDGDADNPGDIDGNGDVDPKRDKDSDYPTRDSYRLPDTDDSAVFSFGHAASGAQARALSAITTSYYRAAEQENGAAACALLPATFARTVPESYGGAAGPPFMSGDKTCAEALRGLFVHDHDELDEPITVLRVRVRDKLALAIIGSRKLRASELSLTRQGGIWQVAEIIGQPLP